MKFRWASKTVTATIVGFGAIWGLATLGGLELGRLRARINQLETEKEQLREFVKRLGASRKVAQADILAQRQDEQGRIVTAIRWQEIGHDGVLGPPLTADVLGSLVYFEALVIKFDQELVGAGDAQRGSSLAMFRRVFGDRQPPDSGYPLTPGTWTPGEAHFEAVEFESVVWKRFWELVEDPALARQYGVRIAQIEAPAVPVKAGQVWEVRLDAAGGLNIRQIARRAAPSLPTEGSRSSLISPAQRYSAEAPILVRR